MVDVKAFRVQEVTTSEGVGAMTLAGPTAGMRGFADAGYVEGDQPWLLIENLADDVVEWEITQGTIGANGSFTRATPLLSSTGTETIDFSAGTKAVTDITDTIGSAQAQIDAAEALAIATANAGAGGLAYETKAELDADLDWPANRTAEVYDDGGNNGVYIKAGAEGVGSWTKISGATIPSLDVRVGDLETDVPAIETRVDTAEGSISTLTTGLASEVTNRTNADTAIAATVTAEASARASADAALGTRAGILESVNEAARSIQTLGVSTTPVTGSNVGLNTYAFAASVVADGYVSAIRVFSANAGIFPIRIFSRSGNTLTQVGSDYPVTVAAGVNALTPVNFGNIPVEAGQYVGFYGAGIGRITYVTGASPYRSRFSVSGDQTSFTPSGVNTNDDFQIGIDISFEERVEEIEDSLEEVRGNFSTAATQLIGVPSTPIDATSGSAGTIVLDDPVLGDGLVTRIYLYVESAGTVPIYVYRKVTADDFVAISVTDLAVEAGLNDLSSDNSDFDAIPVKAGQYLGWYSDGNVNYKTTLPASGPNYRRDSANKSYLFNPTLNTSTKQQVGFFVEYDELLDPATFGEASDTPLATDGSTLHRLKALLAKRLSASAAVVRIGMIGDSWTQNRVIPQAIKDLLIPTYGESGPGWISCDADGPLDGVAHSISGWTIHDASEDVLDPAIGVGIDGKAIHATGTSATVQIVATFQTMKIPYLNGDGTFRWRIDGGSWTSVVGDTSDALAWVSIGNPSPLTDASHTLDIDLTGNTGTVVIYGFLARRTTSGVEMSKLGNGGIAGFQINTYLDDYSAPYWDELDLDVLIVILGTNDYRDADATLAEFTTALTAIAAQARTAVPDVGIILWGPADSNGTEVLPLTHYVDEMYRLSGPDELDCEFFNNNRLFGTWAEMDALGAWSGNLHLNALGSLIAAKDLVRKFFWADDADAVTTLTLTANAASTTLTDGRIGPATYIGLTPTTANAAAAYGTTYVSARSRGSATITHANNAQVDKTFLVHLAG